MKKYVSLILVLILSFSCFASAASYVTMYSLDGRQIDVLSTEIEAYKNVGWYENATDVERVIMYAMDGRQIEVARVEIPAYRNVGWYETIEEVTQVMYSMDGRQIVVYKAEVPAYKNVGWYENLSEVTKIMYSMDGRQLAVFIDEIPAYKNVGWYETLEEVTQTVYAPDGRELVIYKAELSAYKNVGWYENKFDIEKVTMYAPDGRTIEVMRIEVPAYKNVGWYENATDVEKVTMYAPDGREIEIIRAEIPAYKNVGWYEEKTAFLATVCSKDGRKLLVSKSEVDDYINAGWIPAQSNEIDPTKPMVALTFDDGPKTSTTGRVLDVMELYNTRATFFVLGNLASGNTAMLSRMNSLGCQIGNHSYSHPNLTKQSSANVTSQITRTSDIIFNAVGKYPTVVRPPYGSYNKTVLNAAAKPFILWSIDTLDWKHRDATKVYNAVFSKVRDGDIILMHDIYTSTATAVENIVPELLRRGYQLVTIEELARYKNKPLNAYTTYSSFR